MNHIPSLLTRRIASVVLITFLLIAAAALAFRNVRASAGARADLLLGAAAEAPDPAPPAHGGPDPYGYVYDIVPYNWTDIAATGTLGTGREVELPQGLSRGWRTITLTARDSDGMTGTASVQVCVGCATIYLPVALR